MTAALAPLPETVEIEIDSRCNLRCAMCLVSREPVARHARSLGTAEVTDLVDRHFSHVKSILLCGYSEPLLNPDVVAIVGALHARGKHVNLSTNGLLLTPEKSRALLAAGLDDVSLSLDSVDPETFRRIRGVARLETVLANLRALGVAIRETGARCAIELRTVVSAHNARELDDILHFAAREGVRSVTFIREMFLDATREHAPDPGAFAFDALDWRAVSALAARLGVELSFSVPRADGTLGCRWASEFCYVSVEGDVSPCQFAAGDPAYRFGNVSEAPLATIYARAPYVAFRDAVARGERPAPCRGCGCVFQSAKPRDAR